MPLRWRGTNWMVEWTTDNRYRLTSETMQYGKRDGIPYRFNQITLLPEEYKLILQYQALRGIPLIEFNERRTNKQERS